MRPKAQELAMRDPALAAITGVLPGADFGCEADGVLDAGAEFGFGVDPNLSPFMPGAEFGDDGEDYSWEFGSGGYYGYGAAASAPALHPAAVQQIVAKHVATQRNQAKRTALLEPNKGSSVKVERYTFPLNQTLTLGTAVALSLTQQPDVTIRPQRVVMNAPTAGFCTIATMKVANVSVIVGATADAFEFSPLAVGSILDMPTLSPANRATVSGNYTGFVPPGFVGAASFLFVVSFQGPASIVA